MIKIAHIIPYLSAGGAARAMAAVARTSKEHGAYHHAVFTASQAEPQGINLVQENGMEFIPTASHAEIVNRLSDYDIVQIEWWNSPDLDELLRLELPDVRTVSWFHVAGDRAPQYIPPEMITFSDIAVASSPKCYRSPSFVSLSEAARSTKTAMAYDCADFQRMKGITLKPHSGFTVGYIGTVHYIKMHREFLRMSAEANIPDARFVVCGDGAADEIRSEAREMGVAEKFEFKGYVDDIVSEISAMDVYGYPLCDDTYASAELNLQEVMYAGVPPIVFPSGGIESLVVNNFTGLVVHTPREYTQALEFLYQHPEERSRLGKNAAEYAKQIFGEEIATRVFHDVYQRVLASPKRPRVDRIPTGVSNSERPASLLDLVSLPEQTVHTGTLRFIDSLGDPEIQKLFLESILEQDQSRILNISKEIGSLTPLMKTGGIKRYREYYPDEPFLQFWNGLALWGDRSFQRAVEELASSAAGGMPHPVALYFIADAALETKSIDLAHQVVAQLEELEPSLPETIALKERLKGSAQTPRRSSG